MKTKMKSLTKNTLAALIAISFGGFGSSAMASSYECDSGPESAWKTTDEARAALVTAGYKVRKIKVGGGCYEAYAMKDGKKLEVFVNPATLEFVKIKED